MKKVLLIVLLFFFVLNAVNASDNSTTDEIKSETAEVNTTSLTDEGVNVETSQFKASDYTAYVGVDNTYKVVLTANNIPLSKKVVKFTIDGKTSTSKTNSKGEASFKINLPQGSYNIQYSYDGDGTTSKVTGQSKIIVKQLSKTTIKKANSIIYRNKKSNAFKVKLLDIRSDPIKNAKITFKINKKKYVRTTNSEGIASFNIRLKTGSYKVHVVFYKTSKFLKSSKTFKIKVKPKQARNNGMWLRASDMDAVNFDTLQKYAFKHIFLNAKALETHGRKGVEKFIKEAKAHKIKVHIWMQVFYSADKGWLNPVKKSGINYNLISSKVKLAKSYAKLKGVGGVHFDYLRYPGNAYNYKNGVKAINYFAKTATKAVHKINKKIIVSAAVMPEPSVMKKYYGQDIPSLGKYLDVIVPMVYKGNYNGGHEWIKFVTKAIASKSKHAKIWCGLQTYKSDKKLTKLSANELMGDSDTAALAGAYGIILFRFGLFNYINFNNV